MKHALIAAAALACTTPAAAQEVFAGAYAHGVETPFTLETGEGGADVVAGVRFDGIRALSAIGSPAPYLIGALSTRGDTSFAGAGLAWTIGEGPLYLRPAIGLVVHDGPQLRTNPATGVRTDLGSRVLFEPEIGLGYRLNQRLSAEASWMHVSHARLFNGDQNPGIDMIGVRLAYRLR